MTVAFAMMMGVLIVAPETGRMAFRPSVDGRHEQVRLGKPLASATYACIRALKPIEAGSFPRANDFVSASCEGSGGGKAFRYDSRARAVRSIRDVRAGETVAALPETLFATVMPGQPLLTVVHVGPVRVERQVEALQPARPGQRLFVRTQDGEVFPIAYPSAQP